MSDPYGGRTSIETGGNNRPSPGHDADKSDTSVPSRHGGEDGSGVIWCDASAAVAAAGGGRAAAGQTLFGLGLLHPSANFIRRSETVNQ